METLCPASQPRLAVGCRLRELGKSEQMLLLPEGVLRLKGTGAEVICLCDGEHTFAEIVQTLKTRYAAADPTHIEHEVESFLRRLQQRRVIDF